MEAVPKYKVGSNALYEGADELLKEGRILSAVPVNYTIYYQIAGEKNFIHEDRIMDAEEVNIK